MNTEETNEVEALREMITKLQEAIKDAKAGFQLIKDLPGFQLPQAYQIALKWLDAYGDKK